jgi:hypothetical protein
LRRLDDALFLVKAVVLQSRDLSAKVLDHSDIAHGILRA